MITRSPAPTFCSQTQKTGLKFLSFLLQKENHPPAVFSRLSLRIGVNHMIFWLFRLLLLFAIIVIIYTVVKYIKDPQRQLQAAERRNQFYFLDDPENARKNLFIVYHGVRFEGEKYVGATEEAFVVNAILMRILEPKDLVGLTREDFYTIEREIYSAYPAAEIRWQNPVDDFLKHQN